MAKRKVKTPPEFAEDMRVKPEKVVGWIRSGELEAVDVANEGSSRPRFRITPEAIEAFLKRRRTTKPAAKTTAPRRRKASSDVVEFV